MVDHRYNCSKILSGYDFCFPTCDMCIKRRSTSLIEAAIDKAAALGYTEQIMMGWSLSWLMQLSLLQVFMMYACEVSANHLGGKIDDLMYSWLWSQTST